MHITYSRSSSPVQQPCFTLYKHKGQWTQVRVVRAIFEHPGGIKNEIELPDGTVMEVENSSLTFDGRRKRFIPHPGYQEAEGF